MRPKRVERLLHAHRIRRLSAEEVVSALQAPALTVAPGVADAASEHIALPLPRLCLVHSQRQRCGVRIEALLDELQAADEDDDKPMEYSDVAILRSLPGVGRIAAATIIAEASAALTERDYRALRGHAGIAPVTKQSGKQRMVLMRYACNERLRHAFYHCARVAVIRDLPSKSYYTALRRRGHTHGRALRAVADRLLRILIAMLTTHTLFDSSKARTRGIETLSEKVA
ncbi:MAG TPA: transposase [Candidatus Acidoferrales bacterium]|nr:transposase [Candidatus Acidoferrales bacterium]